ncbi:hypothetical protein HDU83_006597 [Entophlyctis luteolus]|nr:hypothetical protein HDU83_006938 [Entophlyctis luteolus]KAJ3341490.1 hypothetical protein HDU83_006597 [Entophlyctis luteolus]
MLTKECCALTEFQSAYAETGSLVCVLGNAQSTPLDYYAAPKSATSARAILWIHDIFGLHPNSKQTADILAARLDAHVLVPEFFRGARADRTQGREKVLEFASAFDYPAVRADVARAVAWLRTAHGVERVGVFGLCWGGRIAVRLGAEAGAIAATDTDTDAARSEFARVVAVGTAHPARLEPADGARLRVPLCLLPSAGEDEATMRALFELVRASDVPAVAAASVHERFADCKHGWLGAHANFEDADERRRASDALDIAARFFDALL